MNNIKIFDRTLLRLKRQRAAQNFHNFDFLFTWTKKNIQDRLSVIKRDFHSTLQIGARCNAIIDNAFLMDISPVFKTHITAEEDTLPLADQSLDLIISPLNLHAVNDLPGALIQIRKALKPDGLFIAALFGGETLHELRDTLTQTEMSLKGGVSPRVFPFADKQQMGALMQRAGFALPVVDSEIATVTYENIFKLMNDLRGMGESNIIAARDKTYLGKTFFLEAAQYYHSKYVESDGRIPATFEIIFLIGWAPHDSQQKPLKPGSAEHSLTEALKN